MTDNTILLIKIITGLLPFIVLCFTARKNNLPDGERSKQFFMPVIALIYSVATMIFIGEINDMIIKFLHDLPLWVADLANLEYMPEFLKEHILNLSTELDNYIKSLDLNFWIFFISNVFILSVYMLFKKVCLKLIRKFINQQSRLHDIFASPFYEDVPDIGLWCVLENYSNARSLLKVFYFSSVFISSTLMVVTYFLFKKQLIASVFYPVFGVILVGELFFYLDAKTKREMSSIYGEEEDVFRIVNYSLIRKYLRTMFSDKLLAENTSINNMLVYNVTNEEILTELEKSEDQKVTSFAAYYSTLNKLGFNIDHNYLYSSLDLLNKKSILFNNPFYNDLVPYAFYPMNRTLLSHKKVLIVLGRHAIEKDIENWVRKGVESITNIPFMWNVGQLTRESQPELDIGIVSRSDVYDIKLHEANSDFFENVEFFVIIEPSKLISTAQIGLNLIVKKCKEDEKKEIVYCLCDKNCDGLVDAMSHILMTSITEVSATNKHKGTCSYMCWEADGDYLHHRLLPNISRYLGLGTELSFAGLKNQVEKVQWYGGDAFPVTDIRWIDKQYYYDLLKFAGLPANQEAFDEHFITSENFWSAEIGKNNYYTVEDESFNMFEILRNFSTRSTEQGFVNVISTDYLLKDYMADNASIFETDAKAIPYIVADYARTNRNVILRLILMMSTVPVCEAKLKNELSLIGIKPIELKKQLWYEIYMCFAHSNEIATLSDDYFLAVQQAVARSLYFENSEEITCDIFEVNEVFNLKLAQPETVYTIKNEQFISHCVSELKSAGYVAEDEKGNKNYMGSELKGHIYQKYLPGQFFTFAGKYYEMQHLTADGEILVRRAADHIDGRPTYRQIRQYTITGSNPSTHIGANQDIAGMKISKEYADITVSTPGYFRMGRYNDFASGKKVSFEKETETNSIPDRIYKNKEILKIELPDSDGTLTDEACYTIAVLFNEVFKTIFAENQPYIVALTDDSFVEKQDDVCYPLTYSIKGDGYEIKKHCLYIIEDSQLDLGLTVAVERNLDRIFKIIDDYLDWHHEAVENSINPPQPPVPPITFTPEMPEVKKEPKGKVKKFIEKVKKKFKKEKPEDNGGDNGQPVAPIVDNSPVQPTDDHIAKDEPIADSVEQNESVTEPTVEAVNDESGIDVTPTSDASVISDAADEYAINQVAQDDFTDGESESEVSADDVSVNESTADLPTETEEVTQNDITADELVESELSDIEITQDEAVAYAPEGDDSRFEVLFNIAPPIRLSNESNGETATDGEIDEQTETEEETQNVEEEPDNDEESEIPVTNSLNIPERKPYHNRYYLLYGDKTEPSHVDYPVTSDYVSGFSPDKSPLRQARDGKKQAEYIEATYKPGKDNIRYCDFCGTEIYGIEYDTLADGRDRCLNCSRTAIKTQEDFKKIFEDVKRNMESAFGIRFNCGIRVEMVNSKTLHRHLGETFIPTPRMDGRILGVAIKDKNGYTLMVENGSPRMASMLTMAHELTHIWQYQNWNDKLIRKTYGDALRLEIYEGMAKWVEIQYAYLINEPVTAKREEILTSYRNDEYGRGFLRYRAQYPFSQGTIITKPTPFESGNLPISDSFRGGVYYGPARDDGVYEGGIGSATPLKKPLGPKAKKFFKFFAIILTAVLVALFMLATSDGNSAANTTTSSITTAANTSTVSGSTENFTTTNAPPVQNAKPNLYAYNLLTEQEKAVYDQLYEAIQNMQPTVDSFSQPVKESSIDKIIDYIIRDNPQLFWVNGGATWNYNEATKIVNSVNFKYCYTKAQVVTMQGKIDSVVNQICSKINSGMSQYDILLTTYESLINMMDYDTLGLNEQKKTGVKGGQPDELRSIYGAFVNKKSVCVGYARATQYILQKYGIECVIVDSIESENHAWNLAKIDGDYYHIDTTWGDGTDTDTSKKQSKLVNYSYLALTTADLSKIDSHTPNSDMPVPTCTSTKCNYFRKNGIFFDTADYQKFQNLLGEAFNSGKNTLMYQCANKQVYEQMMKHLIDDNKIWDYVNAVNTSGKKFSNQTYSYNEDFYTVSFNFS